MRVSRGPVAVVLDPGWLYLLPGVALVAAALLIPSHDRLEEVRWQRARAEALRGHLEEKLARHERYAEALQRGGETLLLSLAASQLNMVPAGTAPMVGGPAGSGASVFEALEPPPPELPGREVAESRLRGLAMHPRSRVWLLSGGLLAVFVGLLPRTRGRAELAEREAEEEATRRGLAAARERAEALWWARGDEGSEDVRGGAGVGEGEDGEADEVDELEEGEELEEEGEIEELEEDEAFEEDGEFEVEDNGASDGAEDGLEDWAEGEDAGGDALEEDAEAWGEEGAPDEGGEEVEGGEGDEDDEDEEGAWRERLFD